MLTKNDVVDAARAKCADPVVDAEWKASWNNVINHIEPLFKKKGIKVFEVHHRLEVARFAFLCAAVDGASMDDCERAGIDAVSADASAS